MFYMKDFACSDKVFPSFLCKKLGGRFVKFHFYILDEKSAKDQYFAGVAMRLQCTKCQNMVVATERQKLMGRSSESYLYCYPQFM